MIKNQLLSIVALLLISITSYAQQGTELLIKANKASLEKDYALAISYYTQYIEMNPKDFRGYFNRGTTEYNANLHSDGIADFTKCLQLNPIYKEAYYYRAKCKEGLNKHADAILDYTHVLADDSLNVGFLKARAQCYSSLKRHKDALSDLDLAVRVNKLDGNIYKQRALVRIELKDLTGAIDDYDMVEALIPNWKMVHYLKGNLYLELQMMDEACSEWQLALEHRVVVAERNVETYCGVLDH